MPRDLPLGNGDLLVTFDARYQLRDLYFPNVGLENHTMGNVCRFGVWVDGLFSWIGDDGWERDIRYAHETLVSEVTLGNARLGLRLRCRDAVDFDAGNYPVGQRGHLQRDHFEAAHGPGEFDLARPFQARPPQPWPFSLQERRPQL